MNHLSLPDNREHLRNRAWLEKELRHWFHSQDFLETTTPVILPHSSLEENIEPLQVILHHREGSRQGFLRTSPELSLKKILAAGFPKIFELGPCFRDLEKSSSPQHLNEFTLLEWYHTGLDLRGMMDEVIALVAHLAERSSPCRHGRPVCYQGRTYNLTGKQNWQIISVAEAFQIYAGIQFSRWKSWEEFFPAARERGFTPTNLDDAFYWLFLNFIEPQIRNGPTLIYEYPIFQAAFSEGVKHPSSINPEGLEYGLRFEAYLGGMEICNAFQELVDPEEQRRRWQTYLDRDKRRGELSMDEDFLTALDSLQSDVPLSGIALGWERLLMFLLGVEDIRDIQPLSF